MIVRSPRPTDNCAQINTTALADGTLSFKARGILAYLLSLPAGTEISAEKITRSGTDGERAVKSGLKELEEAGYLIRDDITLTVTDTPGVATETPDLEPRHEDHSAGPHSHLLWLCDGRPWLSPQAVKTAHRVIELKDIVLSVTKYEIRMAELKKHPTSSEWLRWLVEDEEKLRLEQQEKAKSNGDKEPWWATA